jgi:hypothetical protein
MAGQVSILDCVGSALRFVRERWRLVLAASAAGAAVTALLLALGVSSPLFAIVIDVAGWIIQSFVYAAFMNAALGESASRIDLSGGFRMFGAMAVVGFFLFIVFFVLMIPGATVLLTGPMAPYLHDLQQAGQDQAAMMEVMRRFAVANPAPLLAFIAFYGVLWLLLTSRLYLAAPATAGAKRILTFETWAWTKGLTLTILGARILLMAPAFILMGALTYLAARALGVDMSGNELGFSPAFAAYIAFDRLVFFAVFLALEAGLSAAFYRVLKPAQGALPAV